MTLDDAHSATRPRRKPFARHRANRPPASKATRPAAVWPFAVVLAAAGVWAYSTSFTGVFVFDDVPGIVHNHSIESMWPPSRWFGAPPGSTPSGRPLLNLTLAINHRIGGLDVWGYHAVNVAVHVLAGLLLFGILRRTLLSDRLRERFAPAATAIAFAAALSWTLHPLNTEAVTYIVQRGESLMGMFLMATVYFAIRGWPWAAAAACALGMGSKETMIVAPILVATWDFIYRRDGARRRRLYSALAATSLVLLVPMVTETQGRTVVMRLFGQVAKAPGDTWTPWSWLLTQSGVIVHYLRLAFAPWPLVFDYYGWPAARSPLAVLPEAALVAGLLAVTVVAVAKRWPIGFPGAWFFLTLAPTSSLIPIPTEVAAEHRMYMPLAAVLSLAIAGAYTVGQRLTTPAGATPGRGGRVAAVTALVTVLAAGLASLTRARNLDYSSDEAIWRDTVEKRPLNARARLNYGVDLMKAGRAAEAEAQMRAALPLDMDPPTRAQALLQLGSALCAMRRLDEGIAEIGRALAIDPDLEDADAILGQAYADQGNEALAVRHLLRAIDRQPEIAGVLPRAAWVLATARDPAVRDGARAAALADRAVSMTGGQDPVAFEALAAADAELGRASDAVSAIDRALALANARGDRQLAAQYARQRAFYAAGGRVARASGQ